jgi:hypothetical protein
LLRRPSSPTSLASTNVLLVSSSTNCPSPRVPSLRLAIAAMRAVLRRRASRRRQHSGDQLVTWMCP